MKKHSKSAAPGKAQRPAWLKADIARFEALLKQLEYPNAVVQQQAQQAMGVFTLEHGRAKCAAMAAHLDAGGSLENGPRVEVAS